MMHVELERAIRELEGKLPELRRLVAESELTFQLSPDAEAVGQRLRDALAIADDAASVLRRVLLGGSIEPEGEDEGGEPAPTESETSEATDTPTGLTDDGANETEATASSPNEPQLRVGSTERSDVPGLVSELFLPFTTDLWARFPDREPIQPSWDVRRVFAVTNAEVGQYWLVIDERSSAFSTDAPVEPEKIQEWLDTRIAVLEFDSQVSRTAYLDRIVDAAREEQNRRRAAEETARENVNKRFAPFEEGSGKRYGNAVAALHEEWRTIWRMAAGKHSYEEIAEALGLSIPEVATRLHRARAWVRRRLENENFGGWKTPNTFAELREQYRDGLTAAVRYFLEEENETALVVRQTFEQAERVWNASDGEVSGLELLARTAVFQIGLLLPRPPEGPSRWVPTEVQLFKQLESYRTERMLAGMDARIGSLEAAAREAGEDWSVEIQQMRVLRDELIQRFYNTKLRLDDEEAGGAVGVPVVVPPPMRGPGGGRTFEEALAAPRNP